MANPWVEVAVAIEGCRNVGESDVMDGKVQQNAVALLTAGAAALLSVPVNAEAPPEKSSVGFRLSRYAEGNLARPDVLEGATTDRYTVDIQQLKFLTPIGARFALSADVIRESMTGASPLGGVKVAEGDVRVAMSGASIREEREDVALGIAWYGDSTVIRTSGGKSVENDYEADYASVGFDTAFNHDASTLGLTLSASNDVLTPADAESANRIPYAEKENRSAYLGYTQVVSKNFLFQTGIGISRLEGYLSDPYKAGSVINPQDRRPGERTEHTWTFGTRYFVEGLESALQFDYRYFTDNWGIDSHTARVGVVREVGENWQLGTSVRWYMQSEANFYEPYAVPQVTPQPRYFSMDYRLSPYGAISVNVHGKWEFALDWAAVFVIERYESDASFAVANIQLENPAIVDFVRGSLGLEYRF